jgi:NAD(P)-dependent dehydrogenase (short-subunit alcohol dehydrogenase family)
MSTHDFDGKVVIVTGAAGGLGRAFAQGFASAGASLVVADIDMAGVDETAALISATGAKAVAVKVDVTSKESTDALAQAALDAFGRIDVLINNAGISKSNVSWKTTADEWNQTMAINLNAPFFLSQAVIPSMRANAFGRIINITSVVAQTGFVGTSAYAASKAGLIGLTKTLSKELAKFQISVNAIALGYFNTGMIDDVPAEVQTELLKQVPMNTLGNPETLAKTIEFLISDEAGFVTGQTVNLNGGLYS